MERPYWHQLFSRASREAVRAVIARSWPELGVKLVIAGLVIAALYVGVERLDPRTNNYDDQVIMAQAVVAAMLAAAILLFVVNLLFVAPYQLWREEKRRADQAWSELTGTEAAQAVAACTTDGVVDLERLRKEMDRITDPNREYSEEWEQLRIKDEAKRVHRQARGRLQAEESAKAEMMRKRLATRNHSIAGASESYLAALWDAEQRGEVYDETHQFTLRRVRFRPPS